MSFQKRFSVLFILALPGKVLQVFSLKMFPQVTQIHVAARAANMG
jgi:hypothetical protein